MTLSEAAHRSAFLRDALPWFELIDRGGDPATIFRGLNRQTQAQLERLSARLGALAEPAAVVGTGAVLVVVVVTLVLPLLDLYGGLAP